MVVVFIEKVKLNDLSENKDVSVLFCNATEMSC